MSFTNMAAKYLGPPKSIAPFIGIGAGFGALHGAYYSMGQDSPATSRVTHWKARHDSAESEPERRKAKDKLDYWNKVDKKSKRKKMIRKILGDTVQGAGGGATAFISLQRLGDE